MKVLVMGSGAREHALVREIVKSPLVSRVFCIPGSDAISQLAICLPIPRYGNQGLANVAEAFGIGLTVVGPEAYLVGGIVDEFEKRKLLIVGPTRAAAQIEGSKVWAKRFMAEHHIPTANFQVFSDQQVVDAKRHAAANLPCVVKANGLAAGKAVILCRTQVEALRAIDRILVQKEFGQAGDRVVIEDLLEGEEATFMVLTDGWNVIPTPVSKDYKPVDNGNQGPNTGGMGAYAPALIITPELKQKIMEDIVGPTITGMREKGILCKGILYVGLMVTTEGPKVLEYNCRFGDPELQPLILLMESDIVPVLEAIALGDLSRQEIRWAEGAAVCVVMASRGYPGDPETDMVIKGLTEVRRRMKDVVVFHAGTKEQGNLWKTAGGRVLAVTARGRDVSEARDRVYRAISLISWPGEHHRTDIACKVIA